MTIRVVAFILFVHMVWPFAAMSLLQAAGFCPSPRDHIAFLAGPMAAQAGEQAVQTLPMMRLNLLAVGLAFPLQLASVFLGLPRFAGVRLEQIGWTPRRFGRNGLAGVAGWLILTPICFGVNYAVLALYGSQAAGAVQDHPFVQMAAQGLTPLEWFLLIFSATVAAPVLEETLFRGALQSWLEGRAWASHLVMGLALLTAVGSKGGDVAAAWPRGGAALLLHLAPILFVLALFTVYFVIHAWSRTPAAPAIFAASTLFAAVHSFAWPSPVALFGLALGLGWLAQRTRSLVGPTVLHGLFNAVSCALLFWK